MYERVVIAVEDFAVLFEFWKEGEGIEEDVKSAYENAIKEIEEAEFKSTLNGAEDELPGILQINSGGGGTESQDWAEMLARM
jgi:peptide chain release factor 2